MSLKIVYFLQKRRLCWSGMKQEAHLTLGHGPSALFCQRVLKADEAIVGCFVPRRQRKGSSRPRSYGLWPSLALAEEDLDGTFHEDEREALEALFCLSGASVQPATCRKQQQYHDKPASTAASKPSDQWQPQEQNSKGSSETACLLYGSCKAAVAVNQCEHKQQQLTRQYSPSSDVSSGAYHTALMIHEVPQHLDEEQQQVMQLTDIHPAALLPGDALLKKQTATAALPPPAARQDLHQQIRQVQQQLCKPAAQPSQQLNACCDMQKVSSLVLQQGANNSEQSSEVMQLAAASAAPSANHQGPGQGLYPTALAAALQASVSPALLPAIMQQLLASVPGSGSTTATVPDFMAQLLLPLSMPGAVPELLKQLLWQQLPAASRLNSLPTPRLPVPGGQMHVHIAHMIAQGRRKQQAEKAPQVAGDAHQQQKVISGTGVSLHDKQPAANAFPQQVSGLGSKSEKKRKAASASERPTSVEEGGSLKRQKQLLHHQQMLATLQHPLQGALIAGNPSLQMALAAAPGQYADGMLGGLAGALPHMASAVGAGATLQPTLQQVCPPTSSAAQFMSHVQQGPPAALASAGLQQHSLLAQLMSHSVTATCAPVLLAAQTC